MITDRDFITASSILDDNNWMEITDPNIQKELSAKPKFEKLALLSDEAKFVIRLVLETPKELLRAVVGGHPVVSIEGRITKYRLKKFLKQNNWKHYKIDKAFKEIEEYVEDM